MTAKDQFTRPIRTVQFCSLRRFLIYVDLRLSDFIQHVIPILSTNFENLLYFLPILRPI